MPTLIHRRVELARAGDNPTVICRMRSGWAVLGDEQILPGYSLLLPDPVVGHLTDLDEVERASFLTDMALLGEALHHVTDTVRINYEILGNGEPALHAHLFPRFAWESPKRLGGPVWWYPRSEWEAAPFDPAVHGAIQAAIRAYVDRRLDADNSPVSRPS